MNKNKINIMKIYQKKSNINQNIYNLIVQTFLHPNDSNLNGLYFQLFIAFVSFTLILRMVRKRAKGCKYSRVTKQQKYVFLKLCITQKQSIHEAAFHTGIHYSTAKTILFFHKRQYKNYTSYNVKGPNNQINQSLRMAGYKAISIDLQGCPTQKSLIKIIVNSQKIKKQQIKRKRSVRNTLFDQSQQEKDVKKQDNNQSYIYEVKNNAKDAKYLQNYKQITKSKNNEQQKI